MKTRKSHPRFKFHGIVIEIPQKKAISGRAKVQHWSEREAFWRGAKRSCKVVLPIVGVLLPFLFLEPFLFLLWGPVVIGTLVFVIAPIIHIRALKELASFEYVEAECPHCGEKDQLKPYLSSHFTSEFTVLCTVCGQTCRARANSSFSDS